MNLFVHVRQIALGNDGNVVHIPGLPPMYDYEIEPQSVSHVFPIRPRWPADMCTQVPVPARALTGAMLLAANE